MAAVPLEWLGIAERATVVGAYAALVILGLLVFALAREWFGAAVGVVAALLVLTREPVLSFGLRAYVDLPYICLLLGALLIEVRRPRAGLPVLVLVALAGLIRPEAWLFALAYCWWLRRGDALQPAHLVLAVAAPLLWALSDLIVTGDPLWSLTGTRDNAAELGRKTGLHNVPLTGPRRIGEILREPVLLATIAGAWIAWRRGTRLPLAATGVALIAFACLATAGLPILTRYLLLPAALMAILAARAIVPRTRGPISLGISAVLVSLLLAFAPGQADRLERLDGALDRQAAILDDLEGLVTAERTCAPYTLPNRRGVPQVALWTGEEPRAVGVAQDLGRYPPGGTAIAASSEAVAREFVLDRRDRERRLPPLPESSTVITAGAWVAAAGEPCA